MFCMEVLVMRQLEAVRLRAEILSGRNDGWTERMMRERLERLVGAAN
jgi:hypothetical protein